MVSNNVILEKVLCYENDKVITKFLAPETEKYDTSEKSKFKMYDFQNFKNKNSKIKNNKSIENLSSGKKFVCYETKNVAMKILRDPELPTFIVIFHGGNVTDQKNRVHLHLTRNTEKAEKTQENVVGPWRKKFPIFRPKSKKIEVAMNRLIKNLRKKKIFKDSSMHILMKKSSIKKMPQKQRSLNCFFKKTLKDKLKLEMYPYKRGICNSGELLIGAILKSVNDGSVRQGKFIVTRKLHTQDEIVGFADWLKNFVKTGNCTEKILEQIESKNIRLEDIQLIVTVALKQKKVYFPLREDILSKLRFFEYYEKIINLKDKRFVSGDVLKLKLNSLRIYVDDSKSIPMMEAYQNRVHLESVSKIKELLSNTSKENADLISSKMTRVLSDLREAQSKIYTDPSERVDDAIDAVKREIGQYFYHSGEVKFELDNYFEYKTKEDDLLVTLRSAISFDDNLKVFKMKKYESIPKCALSCEINSIRGQMIEILEQDGNISGNNPGMEEEDYNIFKSIKEFSNELREAYKRDFAEDRGPGKDNQITEALEDKLKCLQGALKNLTDIYQKKSENDSSPNSIASRPESLSPKKVTLNLEDVKNSNNRIILKKLAELKEKLYSINQLSSQQSSKKSQKSFSLENPPTKIEPPKSDEVKIDIEEPSEKEIKNEVVELKRQIVTPVKIHQAFVSKLNLNQKDVSITSNNSLESDTTSGSIASKTSTITTMTNNVPTANPNGQLSIDSKDLLLDVVRPKKPKIPKQFSLFSKSTPGTPMVSRPRTPESTRKALEEAKMKFEINSQLSLYSKSSSIMSRPFTPENIRRTADELKTNLPTISSKFSLLSKSSPGTPMVSRSRTSHSVKKLFDDSKKEKTNLFPSKVSLLSKSAPGTPMVSRSISPQTERSLNKSLELPENKSVILESKSMEKEKYQESCAVSDVNQVPESKPVIPLPTEVPENSKTKLEISPKSQEFAKVLKEIIPSKIIPKSTSKYCSDHYIGQNVENIVTAVERHSSILSTNIVDIPVEQMDQLRKEISDICDNVTIISNELSKRESLSTETSTLELSKSDSKSIGTDPDPVKSILTQKIIKNLNMNLNTKLFAPLGVPLNAVPPKIGNKKLKKITQKYKIVDTLPKPTTSGKDENILKKSSISNKENFSQIKSNSKSFTKSKNFLFPRGIKNTSTSDPMLRTKFSGNPKNQKMKDSFNRLTQLPNREPKTPRQNNLGFRQVVRRITEASKHINPQDSWPNCSSDGRIKHPQIRKGSARILTSSFVDDVQIIHDVSPMFKGAPKNKNLFQTPKKEGSSRTGTQKRTSRSKTAQSLNRHSNREKNHEPLKKKNLNFNFDSSEFGEISSENFLTGHKISKSFSEKFSEQFSKKISRNFSEFLSEKYLEEISEKYSREIPNKYSGEISKKYSDEISEKFSKKFSDKFSKEISEKYSREISDKYSEEISETFSENFGTEFGLHRESRTYWGHLNINSTKIDISHDSLNISMGTFDSVQKIYFKNSQTGFGSVGSILEATSCAFSADRNVTPVDFLRAMSNLTSSMDRLWSRKTEGSLICDRAISCVNLRVGVPKRPRTNPMCETKIRGQRGPSPNDAQMFREALTQFKRIQEFYGGNQNFISPYESGKEDELTHGVSKYENRPSRRNSGSRSKRSRKSSRSNSPNSPDTVKTPEESVVTFAEPSESGTRTCHTFFHFTTRRTTSPRPKKEDRTCSNIVTMPITSTNSVEMLKLFGESYPNRKDGLKSKSRQNGSRNAVTVPCGKRCKTPSSIKSRSRKRFCKSARIIIPPRCVNSAHSSTSAPSSGAGAGTSFSADDEEEFSESPRVNKNIIIKKSRSKSRPSRSKSQPKTQKSSAKIIVPVVQNVEPVVEVPIEPQEIMVASGDSGDCIKETEMEIQQKVAIQNTIDTKEQQIDRQELINKIRNTLADVTKTIVDISSKYMPLMERVELCNKIKTPQENGVRITKSRNIVVDEQNGESSVVKILNYADKNQGGITCKRVLSRSLKNSLMILKKINEVSKSFIKSENKQQLVPKKPEVKISTNVAGKPPKSKSRNFHPVVETKFLRVSKNIFTQRSHHKKSGLSISDRDRVKKSSTSPNALRDHRNPNFSLLNKYQVQVKTLGPPMDLRRREPQARRITSQDSLDNLTLDRLPPIHSEYPRRDHLKHASVENTFLYKLVSSLEPKISCTDKTCGTCKRALDQKSDGDIPGCPRAPLNCDMGSRRGGKSFNFKKYISDLRQRHTVNLGAGTGYPLRPRILQAFPVHVARYSPPRQKSQVPPNQRVSTATGFQTGINNSMRRLNQIGMGNLTASAAQHRTINPNSLPPARGVIGAQSRSNAKIGYGRKVWPPRSPSSTTNRSKKSTTNTSKRTKHDIVIGGPRSRNKAEQIFNKNFSTLPPPDIDKSMENVVINNNAINLQPDNSQNRVKLQKYIEAIEDKFLKTFSLPEKEKAAAYKTLESEIKNMLDILSGTGMDKDFQNLGIATSLERLCSVTKLESQALEEKAKKEEALSSVASKQAVQVSSKQGLKKKCVAKSQPTICRDSISFINSLQQILSKQSMQYNVSQKMSKTNQNVTDQTSNMKMTGANQQKNQNQTSNKINLITAEIDTRSIIKGGLSTKPSRVRIKVIEDEPKDKQTPNEIEKQSTRFKDPEKQTSKDFTEKEDPRDPQKRLILVSDKKLSPGRGSSDSVYSSDFETLCEETASEQSVQNICEAVGLIHQSQVALIEHFANVQEIILNQFITDISVVELPVADLSLSLIPTHSSCPELKRTSVSRPMSKRMLDFLELITSISFADTAISDDVEPENLQKETIFVYFCKELEHVMDKHYISRCYRLPRIYQQVICEYTGYVNDLIENLSKTNERIGALVPKNNENHLSNYRLVSTRSSRLSSKCLPNFYVLDPVQNSGAYGESRKNNPLGTVCHTMVVNLQLVRDSRVGFNCSPKYFPGRRRRNHLRCSGIGPGRPPDISSDDMTVKDIPMENPMVQKRHCNSAHASRFHFHTNKNHKIKSHKNKCKNPVSSKSHRDHTALLFFIYVITFVLIFSCLIVNYKCE